MTPLIRARLHLLTKLTGQLPNCVPRLSLQLVGFRSPRLGELLWLHSLDFLRDFPTLSLDNRTPFSKPTWAAFAPLLELDEVYERCFETKMIDINSSPLNYAAYFYIHSVLEGRSAVAAAQRERGPANTLPSSSTAKPLV